MSNRCKGKGAETGCLPGINQMERTCILKLSLIQTVVASDYCESVLETELYMCILNPYRSFIIQSVRV